jgi:tRNA U34 2-thiouridine synthase MnmA/TrmU
MRVFSVFSGGLDSMLASELIRVQGLDVLALFFETPFFTSQRAKKSANAMNLPFRSVDITARHLEIVKRPRHGYGGNMNPCIDCHSLMFRIAGEMLEQEGADFVVSGEVLGQRPMSQNKKALSLIAIESGLNGLLLRPLSARLLSPTLPEKRGWVNRDLLMDFQGRSRKPQMELARKMNIHKYPTPAGGCLLTDKLFSRRLRDLLDKKKEARVREIEALKLGRHFRLTEDVKLVVGRNRAENEALHGLSDKTDLLFTSVSVPGPTALILGDATHDVKRLAAAITASYSDTEGRDKIDIGVTRQGKTEIVGIDVQDKQRYKTLMI